MNNEYADYVATGYAHLFLKGNATLKAGDNAESFLEQLEDSFQMTFGYECIGNRVELIVSDFCDVDWYEPFVNALTENCDAWHIEITDGRTDMHVLFSKELASTDPEIIEGANFVLYDGQADQFAKGLTNDALIACLYEALRRRLVDPLSAALYHPDTVAAKIWTVDDVRSAMKAEGYDGTDEEIDTVLESGELKRLNDDDEKDKEIVRNAVHTAMNDH